MTQQQRDAAMNLPLVREIADAFDARLVDLRDRPPLHPPTAPPSEIDTDDSTLTHDDEDFNDV
ncbi:MAG: hypothetical protein WD294_03330 [Phycisphaeraceae bacterium]